MKKINKLTLNHLSKAEMEKREMHTLKGGCTCVVDPCPCQYEGPQCPSGDDYWGGSSRFDNGRANVEQAWETQQF